MSEAKRDIINAHQAAMLDVLRDLPHPTSAADLFARMGISRATGLKHMTGLREAALVVETTPVCKKTKSPALWTISMAGRRALGDYGRAVERAAARAMAVPAKTTSVFGTTYTPPTGGYQRNSGHTHIASRGVSC